MDKEVTFGEMKQLTDRFNQIIGASQTLKLKRLDKFTDGISESYDIHKDKHAMQMYLTGIEAVMVR